MKRRIKIILVMLAIVLMSAMIVGELNAIDGKGTIAVSVKCAHNLFSKEVIIAPIGNIPNAFYGGETTLAVTLNPAGKYEGRFYPGKYSVYLRDGNGGHPEIQTTTVNAGYQSIVSFIGHAISGKKKSDEPDPSCRKRCDNGRWIPCEETCPSIVTPTPTITPTPTPTPVPCYQVCTKQIIHHPEVNHTVTRCGHTKIIVDEEAWDEIIYTSEWRCDGKKQESGYCIS